jgi:N-acetyl-alpha-D-glucosaminyl L-malate synthase BshA
MGQSNERPMKICVICHPTQGGSGILASELGMAMAQRGHEVHFLSHTKPFRLRTDLPNVKFHKVDISDYPLFKYPPYSIALAGALIDLMSQIDFDIVHVHYAIPHAVSAFLAHRALMAKSPPILVTLHGTDVTVVGKQKQLTSIVGFVLQSCEGLSAVSESLKASSIELFGLTRDITVIPNFVDATRFRPELRSDAARRELAPNGEALIGHMSNFRTVKRVGDVVDLFRRVHQVMPARLVLIGDGPDLPEALLTLDSLGLGEHVTTLGSIQNVERVLAQLDAFLLPSQTESFGLAALEAMACGVPCVVSDAGGLPEVIRNGVEGYTVPVGATADMAARVLDLLNDPELQTRMGAAARKAAVERFALDSIIDRYEALYREVSNQRVPHVPEDMQQGSSPMMNGF